jgi:hypothetical protein
MDHVFGSRSSDRALLVTYQTEAAVIGLVAGSVGAGAGVGFGAWLARRTHRGYPELGFRLKPWWVLLALALV